VLELSGYADDFPELGADIALVFRPEQAGAYVASLATTGSDHARFYVLDGHCEGPAVGAIQGMIGAWSGFSFEALADHEYTFVIEADAEVETVQLTVALGCELLDDAHCVVAGDHGDPECGVRYTADTSTDGASCMPMNAPGEVDAQCPDTTWRGKDVEGCCKPEGMCGHFDEQLGCHDLALADGAWAPDCVPDED
jgi:hypothetical protein